MSNFDFCVADSTEVLDSNPGQCSMAAGVALTVHDVLSVCPDYLPNYLPKIGDILDFSYFRSHLNRLLNRPADMCKLVEDEPFIRDYVALVMPAADAAQVVYSVCLTYTIGNDTYFFGFDRDFRCSCVRTPSN